MDFQTATIIVATVVFAYSAWLTSIVFCSAHDDRPLLIASAAFFPVGVAHGIGIWFGEPSAAKEGAHILVIPGRV